MSDDDDDESRPSAPVTSMSLRAERLRRRMAQAAGAKIDPQDPGLSPARAPRDPALTNRFAIVALTAGIVSVFISGFYVASAVALIFCFFSVRRTAALRRQGREPWGRRRTIWAFWFAVFGVAQYSYVLFVLPLFR